MSGMESGAYLEPGFDPSTLKVAELRGVLLKHDVDYPSSAKKAELLGLFNQHISPQASKLRHARSAIKPSTRGMKDAGRGDSTDLDEELSPPTPSRRGRRSATGNPSTLEQETPRARNTRRASARPSRTPERSAVNTADEEGGRMTVPRSTRRSSARPQVLVPEVESDSDEMGSTSTDTPFSSVNLFQGGSSPVYARTPGNTFRKSFPVESKKRSTSGRRSDVTGVSSTSLQAPARRSVTAGDVSRQRAQPDLVDSDNSDAAECMDEKSGPQDAPESQALVQAEHEEPLQAARIGTNILFTMIIFVLLAYGIWWRREKVTIGFCGLGGLGADSRQGDALVDMLRPSCEPCPAHARCYPGMVLICEEDYVKAPKWYSLGGLVPAAPDCLPDTEKERRKMIMSNAAVEILRKKAAEELCKEQFLRSEVSADGVSEEDLRQVLYDRKAASLSDREFLELWKLALEEVSSRDEVVKSTDNSGTVHLKSTSLVALPLGCSIRFLVLGSLARNRVRIIGIIVFSVVVLVVRSRLTQSKSDQTQITKLVHVSLGRLAQYAATHPEHPYIAVAHLRDQVLQHEFSPKRRKVLWDGVEKVVELNSNVRVGEREVEGDVMRVWSWIGGRFLPAGNQEPLPEEGWDGHTHPVA